MSEQKLVIVESPTKAKTLSKILGKQYVVKASMGHIRDLPKSGLAIDVENNFEPQYEVSTKGKKIISELNTLSKDINDIILATDPDREGEAIAWHLSELLKAKKRAKGAVPLKFSRVVFHEITKSAIEEAFVHATALNTNLVDAQQARRVLDRLVGYKLSPLLWKKVRYGLSAGRVQSIAVRLIVEKERERQAFNSEEYWSVDAEFENSAQIKITASLIEKDGKKLELPDEAAVKKVESDLLGATFKVDAVKRTDRKRKPPVPFKTSTLQQAAANYYGFTAKKTMSAAQKLFEKGLITYHRTDSLDLSAQFLQEAQTFIKKTWGVENLPKSPNIYKTNSKGAQEAHEAIRPTNLDNAVEIIHSGSLPKEEHQIYSLIVKRSLECQMLPAVYDQTTINIMSSNAYGFRATGSIIKFAGWLNVTSYLKMSSDKEDLDVLPALTENELLSMSTFVPEQHFTQPPARYSDASIIKHLEELGIGRPSTYAPTLTTIVSRGYVEKEGRYFVPKDVAYVVNDLLVSHFPDVVDYNFTAVMEEDLDKVAAGKVEWVPLISRFYTPFAQTLALKDKELQKQDMTKLGESDEKCPDCGKILYIKLGKYGKFLSCSGFPDCEYAKPLNDEIPTNENGEQITDFGKCDKCEQGMFLLKQGRFGKFLACNNYPKCKNTKQYLDKIGMNCPECKTGDIVVKKAKRGVFYGCSNYPTCNYASWKNPKLDSADPVQSAE
ncbi:MAG: type I DNA topoisomerase [Patescibacteria group bacterium]|uniref:DNA topoisomerase 1 n=1 Tax=candidate division WWE3 bacterium TaxID=2053526 RepID=A0A955EC90_UNCKA|nr:type I DNA topoisomerase [candidate division WWE3 bacterium]